MRVAALAVVPRVIRVLSRIPQAEAQCPAPVANDQRIEEPAPVVASPVRLQKPPTRRWQTSGSVKRKSPPLCAWWAPTGSRAPPSHFGGSRSWAYTHRRSFPINASDPDGLQPGDGTDYTSGAMMNRLRQMRDRFLPGAQGEELMLQAITSFGDAEDTIDPKGYLLGAAAAAAYHHLTKAPPLEQIGEQVAKSCPGKFKSNDVKMQIIKGKAIVNIGYVEGKGIDLPSYFKSIADIARSKGATEITISWAASNPKSSGAGIQRVLRNGGFTTYLDQMAGAATRIITSRRL